MPIPILFHLCNPDHSLRIKRGMVKRLSAGRCIGPVPVGYLLRSGIPILDPVRSPFVKTIFARWSEGRTTSQQLAVELDRGGFRGRFGRPFTASAICRLLKNPFYAGTMIINGRRYPGGHPAIVSPELFERAQEVFRQKVRGKRAEQRQVFLLVRKVRCPRCDSILTGEHHIKKSGSTYDYYRCHKNACGFVVNAKELDKAVLALLVLQTDKMGLADLRATLIAYDYVDKRRAIGELVDHVDIRNTNEPVIFFNDGLDATGSIADRPLLTYPMAGVM